MARFTYISKRQNDYAISRGLYFHETSRPRSFAKINPREKTRIYINQGRAAAHCDFLTTTYNQTIYLVEFILTIVC